MIFILISTIKSWLSMGHRSTMLQKFENMSGSSIPLLAPFPIINSLQNLTKLMRKVCTIEQFTHIREFLQNHTFTYANTKPTFS